MPSAAAPLVEYFDTTYVSGSVGATQTGGVRRQLPKFPPASDVERVRGDRQRRRWNKQLRRRVEQPPAALDGSPAPVDLAPDRSAAGRQRRGIDKDASSCCRHAVSETANEGDAGVPTASAGSVCRLQGRTSLHEALLARSRPQHSLCCCIRLCDCIRSAAELCELCCRRLH